MGRGFAAALGLALALPFASAGTTFLVVAPRNLERSIFHLRRAADMQPENVGVLNNLAFVLGALLLMAPFGFVPFSNTLPAIALLLLAIGFLQRDGGAVLLGHLANVATIVYFAVLIGGGGLVVKEVFNRLGLV